MKADWSCVCVEIMVISAVVIWAVAVDEKVMIRAPSSRAQRRLMSENPRPMYERCSIDVKIGL